MRSDQEAACRAFGLTHSPPSPMVSTGMTAMTARLSEKEDASGNKQAGTERGMEVMVARMCLSGGVRAAEAWVRAAVCAPCHVCVTHPSRSPPS